MENKTLQALKQYYWLIFLGNAAIMIGILSPLWMLPNTLLRAHPFFFVAVALLLGTFLGVVLGLAHALAQTLENTPRERLKAVLYISLVLGMLSMLLLFVMTIAIFAELMIYHKSSAHETSHMLGVLAMFSWLTSAFFTHALAGFRLSSAATREPAPAKQRR